MIAKIITAVLFFIFMIISEKWAIDEIRKQNYPFAVLCSISGCLFGFYLGITLGMLIF